MFTTYDVDTDRPLSALFRQAFNRAAEKLEFTVLMKLAAPGTGVWEYQKDDHIISLHTYSAEKHREHITIESHTLDLTSLISAALRELMAAQLVALLEPMSPAPRSDIDAALAELFARLGTPDRGPDE